MLNASAALLDLLFDLAELTAAPKLLLVVASVGVYFLWRL
jgi:hypothetical protein